ncbi:acyl-CoA dehydrogenase family protein, partial [Mycobacterium sherrisii]|nr:acyl-CoA dehydrogenase family protein [Mycobacterium sherrisii]
MAWDFETDPDFAEKLSWVRQFIDSEVIPLEPILAELPAEEWDRVKRHLQGKVKAQGLWGLFLDPSLGGQGLGQLKLALMSEIIGRCMVSMELFGVQAPDSGNMELLAHGATEAQKQRWLYPNLDGRISSAFALTEPFSAGADPTVIATTAVLDGQDWIINGHKWFTTNASCADIILVVAETDPAGRPHRHASIVVVPAGTPGMTLPESTSGCGLRLLRGSVEVGVVGLVGVPAAVDDTGPGAGQDADGVGVVVSASAGLGVDGGGPRALVA